MSTPQKILYDIHYKINDLQKLFQASEDNEDLFD